MGNSAGNAIIAENGGNRLSGCHQACLVSFPSEQPELWVSRAISNRAAKSCEAADAKGKRRECEVRGDRKYGGGVMTSVTLLYVFTLQQSDGGKERALV